MLAREATDCIPPVDNIPLAVPFVFFVAHKYIFTLLTAETKLMFNFRNGQVCVTETMHPGNMTSADPNVSQYAASVNTCVARLGCFTQAASVPSR